MPKEPNTIEREIVLRKKMATVVSSEQQERMKVYFKLNKEYKECKSRCATYDSESERKCEEVCSKVYDKYPLQLLDRYKEQPEKLNEKCEGVQIYKRRPREDRTGWWYEFKNTFSFSSRN